MDSLADSSLQDIAGLAALACDTPFASLTLGGADVAWYRAGARMERGAWPAHNPFSVYAVQCSELFEVPDASRDERFAGAALALDGRPVCAYAGAPMRDSHGSHVGTIAVLDTSPRRLSATQRAAPTTPADSAQPCPIQKDLHPRSYAQVPSGAVPGGRGRPTEDIVLSWLPLEVIDLVDLDAVQPTPLRCSTRRGRRLIPTTAPYLKVNRNDSRYTVCSSGEWSRRAAIQTRSCCALTSRSARIGRRRPSLTP